VLRYSIDKTFYLYQLCRQVYILELFRRAPCLPMQSLVSDPTHRVNLLEVLLYSRAVNVSNFLIQLSRIQSLSISDVPVDPVTACSVIIL
jgi:hypothetical protein